MALSKKKCKELIYAMDEENEFIFVDDIARICPEFSPFLQEFREDKEFEAERDRWILDEMQRIHTESGKYTTWHISQLELRRDPEQKEHYRAIKAQAEDNYYEEN